MNTADGPYHFDEDSWSILEDCEVFMELPESMPDWVAQQITDLLNEDFRQRLSETLAWSKAEMNQIERFKLRFND
jgi:hypothetical protein